MSCERPGLQPSHLLVAILVSATCCVAQEEDAPREHTPAEATVSEADAIEAACSILGADSAGVLGVTFREDQPERWHIEPGVPEPVPYACYSVEVSTPLGPALVEVDASDGHLRYMRRELKDAPPALEATEEEALKKACEFAVAHHPSEWVQDMFVCTPIEQDGVLYVELLLAAGVPRRLVPVRAEVRVDMSTGQIASYVATNRYPDAPLVDPLVTQDQAEDVVRALLLPTDRAGRVVATALQADARVDWFVGIDLVLPPGERDENTVRSVVGFVNGKTAELIDGGRRTWFLKDGPGNLAGWWERPQIRQVLASKPATGPSPTPEPSQPPSPVAIVLGVLLALAVAIALMMRKALGPPSRPRR